MQTFLDRMWEESRAKGRVEGHDEGRAEERAASVRQLLRLGLLMPEQIAQAFNMTLDEVLALKPADCQR